MPQRNGVNGVADCSTFLLGFLLGPVANAVAARCQRDFGGFSAVALSQHESEELND